jgi:hypothetical protein
LGAAVFGYDLGVIAYALEAPDFLQVTGLTVVKQIRITLGSSFLPCCWGEWYYLLSNKDEADNT